MTGAAGTASVTGSGAFAFSCPAATFTKRGQDIVLDRSSCGALPPSITLESIKYCATEGTIHAAVSTPFNELLLVAEPMPSVSVKELPPDDATPTKSDEDGGGNTYTTQPASPPSPPSPPPPPASPPSPPASPSPASPPPPLSPPPPSSVDSTAACFGREESLACLVGDATAEAHAAFAACFDAAHTSSVAIAPSATARLVRMSALRAGDRVVSLDAATHAPVLDYVVVNQHVEDAHTTKLLKIETADGAALTVTPDHVIFTDGEFVAASDAVIGKSLSAGVVARVSEISGGIVNPVTTSGTILAADVAAPGKPLLASTHPSWIASFMLSAPTFPFVATRILARIAPEAVQQSYEAVEPRIADALPSMQLAQSAMPRLALPLAVLAADAAFALGTLVKALATPLGLTAFTVVATASVVV